MHDACTNRPMTESTQNNDEIANVSTHEVDNVTESSPPRNARFWLVFVANLLIDFAPALNLTAVSTALPTIVEDLKGSDFIWVGSAYSIASVSVLPLVGGLASSLGRKPVLLAFIPFFAIGSAVCGSAKSMNVLIAGRALQGIGAGGCLSVTEIIYADLVPLPERGKFLGIIASVWALACAIGPPIGGALTKSGNWRWLFYLNIPICGLAFTIAFFFLNIRTPRQRMRNMINMDWMGLLLIISGTVLTSLALAWGGARYAWDSVQILAPLCIGIGEFVAFIVVQCKWATSPTIPSFIMNRTSISGYLGTCIHGVVSMAIIYYLPVYFQAVALSTPAKSGVDVLGLSILIPVAAIASGVSVQIIHRYRPQNYLGWIFLIVGFGLMSTLDVGSSRAMYISYEVILGVGLGMLWISTQFPVLAPLPVSNNSRALAFFIFTRVFAQSWGTVIGGAILQNVLSTRLPVDIKSNFAAHTCDIYTLIPRIGDLPSEVQLDVRRAFVQGLKTIWHVMIGVSGAGLVSCFLMKEVEMRKALDDQFGIDEGVVTEEKKDDAKVEEGLVTGS